MDALYDKLQLSIQHLSKIEKVLDSNKDYKTEKINFKADLEDDLLEFFYSKNSMNNQMALADVVEYIFFARAYHLAITQKSFNSLYKVLLRACNLYFLQDSIISNNYTIRKKFISELKKIKGFNISKQEINDILSFKDSLAPEVNKYTGKKEEDRKRIYDKLDGLMPKILGMPNELIAFLHIIRKKMGYVIPLLLTQKILKGKVDKTELYKEYIESYEDLLLNNIEEIVKILNTHSIDYKKLMELEKQGKNRKSLLSVLEKKIDKKNIEWLSPPDYLLITSHKEIFGIEVGGAKQRQENDFSGKTRIPILTIFSDVACSYRCPICKKWILFSDFVIENGMKQKYVNETKIFFDEIEKNDRDYSKGVCYIKIDKYNKNKRHYHYNCAKKYFTLKDDKIFYYFPFVGGLESIENNLIN